MEQQPAADSPRLEEKQSSELVQALIEAKTNKTKLDALIGTLDVQLKIRVLAHLRTEPEFSIIDSQGGSHDDSFKLNLEEGSAVIVSKLSLCKEQPQKLVDALSALPGVKATLFSIGPQDCLTGGTHLFKATITVNLDEMPKIESLPSSTIQTQAWERIGEIIE
ncbi:MAG: hypothetical protein WC806_01955 [Candidatus Gracilibacteria bacterium]|jgi:hypothetical protein